MRAQLEALNDSGRMEMHHMRRQRRLTIGRVAFVLGMVMNYAAALFRLNENEPLFPSLRTLRYARCAVRHCATAVLSSVRAVIILALNIRKQLHHLAADHTAWNMMTNDQARNRLALMSRPKEQTANWNVELGATAPGNFDMWWHWSRTSGRAVEVVSPLRQHSPRYSNRRQQPLHCSESSSR